MKPGSASSPAALYQVRLYVKDAADFKIVLYHDYFPFTVEPGTPPADLPATTADNPERVRLDQPSDRVVTRASS